MHPIQFSLKRAHWLAVAGAKIAVKKVPRMTPARFDLMYALRIQSLLKREEWTVWRLPDRLHHRTYGMNQNELTRTVGLHRSTVSRMVLQLEELGWVEIHQANDDRRTQHIRLTELGLSIIWRAMRRVLRGRIFLSRYETLTPMREDEHPLDVVDRALTTLWNIEELFGGESSPPYDFGLPTD